MERPEHRLLLACARVCSDSERKEIILSSLGRQIDWEYLLQTAGLHGMTSLLYWHLNKTCPEDVPKAVLERLREHFQRSTFQRSTFNVFCTCQRSTFFKRATYQRVTCKRFSDLRLATCNRFPMIHLFGNWCKIFLRRYG
jgi:hypothetical protein